MKIGDVVLNSKVAKFIYYRKGHLWYETNTGFKFSVPIEDIGDATFQSEERVALMLRYIRRQIALNQEGREAQDE